MKILTARPRFMLGLTGAFFIVLLDQLSKYWMEAKLETAGGFIPLTPFFNLALVHNRGISFGMLSGQAHDYVTWGLVIASLGVVVFLLGWLWKSPSVTVAYALGLVMGGAVGNVIDRVSVGAVTDFLDFYAGAHHWPAFNLADSAIVVGVAILCWDSILNRRSPVG